MEAITNSGVSSWVKYIKQRIKQNKNFLGVFIGQTGSGKSYGALELADLLMDGGLPKENICFKSSSFMARLDDGLTQGTLPKGSVIIWDEAGIGLSAKQWQSRTNRIINTIMQTFRTENIIVLFTVPYLSFIDSDARKLIHAFFQTQRIDRGNKEVICKAFNIQVNQITGKMYRKSLRIYDPSGSLVKIKTIGLSLPRKELVDYYESNSQVFKREVIREGRLAMDNLEDNKKGNIIKLSDKALYAARLGDKGLVATEMAEQMGIRTETMSRILGNVKKKAINAIGNAGFQDMPVEKETHILNSV